MSNRLPVEGRFWQQVTDDGECLLWMGRHTVGGYGQFYADGKLRLAHRWSYERYVGVIPERFQIDHLCRRSMCINPLHLSAVPAWLNVFRSDGLAAINARRLCCVNGHPFDETNTRIDYEGKRRCKVCMNRAAENWKKNHPDKVRAIARGASQRYRARQRANELGLG